MTDPLKLIEILVTLFLGVVGLYLANNYRRQIRQKTTEGRINAYQKLWSLTKVIAPMRKHAWHVGEHIGPLTLEERTTLYDSMTDWYFENGIYLGDSTREIYLTAKRNLLCPDEELLPKGLKKDWIGKPKEEQLKGRSNLSIRQFSLLRHQMRIDLAVYGKPFFRGKLDENDKLFLEHCKRK